MSSTSITVLPGEILVMIVDHLLDSEGWQINERPLKHSIPDLKAFRLTCKRFAYLPRVLEHLFYSVTFQATPEHCQYLRNVNLAKVTSWVQRVTFLPSPYNTDMDRDMFTDIVLNKKINEYSVQHNLPLSNQFDPSDKLAYERYVKGHWGGQYPYTTAEISEGFEYYQDQAQKANALYDSGELTSAWVSALQSLHHCKCFRIADWKEEKKPTEPAHIKCVVMHHSHDWIHRSEHCHRLSTAHGGTPFLAGASALAMSRAQVENLEIVCKHNALFSWKDLFERDSWNLSSLHSLTFNPDTDILTTTPNLADDAGELLMRILSQCADSIVRLTINGNVCFPTGTELVTLSKLHRLETGGSTFLRLGPFVKLLEKMKMLSQLVLDCPNAAYWHEQDFVPWRDVMDAIRNHENRMWIDFTEIPVNSAAEINLSHYTGSRSSEPKGRTPWEDIFRSLANYLSKRGHFNKSMRMWFDNEESGSEDEEQVDS